MTSSVSVSYFHKLLINQLVSSLLIASLNAFLYLYFSLLHFLFVLFTHFYRQLDFPYQNDTMTVSLSVLWTDRMDSMHTAAIKHRYSVHAVNIPLYIYT